MSCGVFHDHFLAGEGPEAFAEHRRACAECRRLSEAFIRMDVLLSRLSPPPVPGGLFERWKEIPSRTVDCDRAAELLALRMEDALPQGDARRLEFHLSRCPACAEACETLEELGRLRRPEPAREALRPPAPVVSFASARARARRRHRERAWLDPRLYAAAACLLAGFFAFFANSAASSPARNLPASIGRRLRVGVAEAADRIGIWEDSVSRRFVATREAVSGYGEAVKGIALSAAGRATGEVLQAATKFERGRKS